MWPWSSTTPAATLVPPTSTPIVRLMQGFFRGRRWRPLIGGRCRPHVRGGRRRAVRGRLALGRLALGRLVLGGLVLGRLVLGRLVLGRRSLLVLGGCRLG